MEDREGIGDVSAGPFFRAIRYRSTNFDPFPRCLRVSQRSEAVGRANASRSCHAVAETKTTVTITS